MLSHAFTKNLSWTLYSQRKPIHRLMVLPLCSTPYLSYAWEGDQCTLRLQLDNQALAMLETEEVYVCTETNHSPLCNSCNQLF